jgi:hypothetical protein
MTPHLLTFEVSKDRDELLVHADEAGLRFLARVATHLADTIATGKHDHTHPMTEDWGGRELSATRQGTGSELLHHVKVIGWPQEESA